MGRLKEPREDAEPPYALPVPVDRLAALVAEQEAGRAFYGEAIYPSAKRRRAAEPSVLLYTTQQFLEHSGEWVRAVLYGEGPRHSTGSAASR